MKEEKTVKDKFLDAMELPLELISDESRISLLGNKCLLIENYKGIIEYDENVIRFVNGVNVFGSDMVMEEISKDEVFITGEILNIEFERGE